MHPKRLLQIILLLSFPPIADFAAETNLALYDSASALITQKKTEKAIPLLVQIVRNDPDFQDSYPIFSELCFFYKKHDLLLETIQKLMQQNSTKGKYFLDVALAYFREEKLTQAEAVLNDSVFLNSDYSQTGEKLLRAKICFTRGKAQAGQDDYYHAIDAIESDADAAAVFQDLIYLVDDAEFACYDSTALPDKTQFFRTFWRRRDPTPLTDFNERLPEHFRRVFYARKHYRKYFSKTLLDNPSLYYDQSYFADSPADEELFRHGPNPFSQIKLPRGMIEQEDINDMGCIFIRHGQPDDSEKMESESPFYQLVSGAGECWQYYATQNRPEVLYFFIARQGSFRLSILPIKTQELRTMNPLFHYADVGRLIDFSLENKQFIETHISLETTDYKYSPKTFEFPYTLVSFKDSRLNSLELYFGVPLKEFKPDKNETELPLQIEKGFVLFDGNWEVIDQWNESNQYETRFKKDAWKEILYLNGKRYRLPAGEYHFALQLDDPVSGKMALYRGDYSLPDYFADSLQLSKIILAKNLQPQTPQSLFAKDGVQFTPKFNGLFERREPMALYYEIYNLNYNSKGQTKYEITYSVWPYSKAAEIENPRKKKPIIRTGTRQNGEKRDEKVWMSFDFSEQKKGKYVIEILVEDQVGGAEVRRLVPVEVE